MGFIGGSHSLKLGLVIICGPLGFKLGLIIIAFGFIFGLVRVFVGFISGSTDFNGVEFRLILLISRKEIKRNIRLFDS